MIAQLLPVATGNFGNAALAVLLRANPAQSFGLWMAGSSWRWTATL